MLKQPSPGSVRHVAALLLLAAPDLSHCLKLATTLRALPVAQVGLGWRRCAPRAFGAMRRSAEAAAAGGQFCRLLAACINHSLCCMITQDMRPGPARRRRRCDDEACPTEACPGPVIVLDFCSVAFCKVT